MRSTGTATRETSLHWERCGGAHAGLVAEYGRWSFRVYCWQRSSYIASAWNHETGEYERKGNEAGEVRTQAEGKAFCEAIYQRLRAEDRARGIERG